MTFLKRLLGIRQEDSGKARSAFEEGMNFAQRGKINDALREFKKAVAADPKYGAAWVNLGNCYLVSGLHSEAIPAYEKALKYGLKEEWGTWDNLGIAYGHEGQHEKAKNAFKNALAGNPEFKNSWGNLGEAHFRLKEYKEAKEAFSKFLKMDPTNPLAIQYMQKLENYL